MSWKLTPCSNPSGINDWPALPIFWINVRGNVFSKFNAFERNAGRLIGNDQTRINLPIRRFNVALHIGRIDPVAAPGSLNSPNVMSWRLERIARHASIGLVRKIGAPPGTSLRVVSDRVRNGF